MDLGDVLAQRSAIQLRDLLQKSQTLFQQLQRIILFIVIQQDICWMEPKT